MSVEQHLSEGIPGMALQVYPSDLNEEERALLSVLLPPAKPGGRPRSIDLRCILNGLFYLVRADCAWRYLPKEYGPWSTVYHYYPITGLMGQQCYVNALPLGARADGAKTWHASSQSSLKVRTFPHGPSLPKPVLASW
jgi:transposase